MTVGVNSATSPASIVPGRVATLPKDRWWNRTVSLAVRLARGKVASQACDCAATPPYHPSPPPGAYCIKAACHDNHNQTSLSIKLLVGGNCKK